MALLDVQNLSMHYKTRKGDVYAVDDVSFKLEQGEALGLIGESGCGKTSLALALLRLIPDNAYFKSGQIRYKGTDLLSLSEGQIQKVRWNGISMVFQAAMNSLNPVHKVGEQIIEAMQAHAEGTIPRKQARQRVAELYELVGLNPDRMDQFQHEYSGGMRQRAVIAMALACDPDVIIADEPTTALDVIVQDRILQRLDDIRRELDMSVIYISHDVAVIAEITDKVGIMYAGNLVEFGPTEQIFHRPHHPYTSLLMSSFPSIHGEMEELVTIPGEPPNLLNPPSGCRFHPRCPYASSRCEEEVPRLKPLFEEGHQQACWHPLNK